MVGTALNFQNLKAIHHRLRECLKLNLPDVDLHTVSIIWGLFLMVCIGAFRALSHQALYRLCFWMSQTIASTE